MRYSGLLLMCILCFTGCRQPQPSVQAPSTQDEYWRANQYLRNNQPQQALAAFKKIQQQHPQDAQACYYLARAYAFAGQPQQALLYYRRALTLDGTCHPAYVSLQGIYIKRYAQLRREYLQLKDQRQQVVNQGGQRLPQLYHQLIAKENEAIALLMDWAEAYLLFEDPHSTLAEFADMDANLRLCEKMLKERHSAQQPEEGRVVKPAGALATKVRTLRSRITLKKIQAHLQLAQSYRQQANWDKAIEELKEADEQLAKFFSEEELDAEEPPLPKVPHLDQTTEKLYQQRRQVYRQYISTRLKSRNAYRQIGLWHDVKDEDKNIQDALERLIEIEEEHLWRSRKIARSEAQYQPCMISYYQQLLANVPDSPKTGDYHLALAYCYLQTHNYSKAWEHLHQAQKKLPAIRVQELAEKLRSVSTEPK